MIARIFTQLSNIMAVMLKCLLDIDLHHFRDSFAILFLFTPFFHYMISVVATEFRYNCQTVKDDAIIIKREFIALYKKVMSYQQKLMQQLA